MTLQDQILTSLSNQGAQTIAQIAVDIGSNDFSVRNVMRVLMRQHRVIKLVSLGKPERYCLR